MGVQVYPQQLGQALQWPAEQPEAQRQGQLPTPLLSPVHPWQVLAPLELHQQAVLGLACRHR